VITYKYALDEDGSIVSIDDLLVFPNIKLFICPDCGKKLAPRALRSEKVSPHFYHIETKPFKCNPESYLHYVSKRLLAESLKTAEPFLLIWRDDISCINENADWGLCYKEAYRYLNLLEGYTDISLEKKDGDFIPDILLTDPQGGKIYIEIFVTSPSSSKKIESGVKIIEIKVSSEKDIEEIVDTRRIYVDDPRIRVNNFHLSMHEITFDCEGKCLFLSQTDIEGFDDENEDCDLDEERDCYADYDTSQAVSFFERFFEVAKNSEDSGIFAIVAEMMKFYNKGLQALRNRGEMLVKMKSYSEYHIILRQSHEQFVFGVYRGECYATVLVENKYFLYKVIEKKTIVISELKGIDYVQEFIDEMECLF